jgi:two-component system chemotaxis response regulator CheY
MQRKMTHLLLVEDDEATRSAVRMVLEEAGHEVFEAPDGRPALDQLRTHPHGLVVLLDRNMPRMDGRELLEAMYAEPALAARHAFVLVSANADGPLPARLSALLTALSVDKVDKPFDLEDLLDADARAEQRFPQPEASDYPNQAAP